MKAALQNYQARMRRVLDYIDRHLDSDLDLGCQKTKPTFQVLALACLLGVQ